MRKVFVVFFFWTIMLMAQPQITAVVNGASFEPTIAPGSLVSIFGSNLAGSTIVADTLPLPKKLGNTSVTVDNVQAPLYFVSAGQINAQIPFEATKMTVSVAVTTEQGKSKDYLINVVPAAPGIFTKSNNGKGPALIFDVNFKPVDKVTPLYGLGLSVFILYATGLGATNPPAVTGAGGGATANTLNLVVNTPEIYIGEEKAEVAYAGLAPGFAGVYQVNVKVPQANFATNRIFIRSKGWQSNIAEVDTYVNPLSGVTGTIEAKYPFVEFTPDIWQSSGKMFPITFSPLLQVGKFTLHLDIPPGGNSVFSIAAVSEAASTVIKITPQNTYESSITVPTAQARNWNFSNTEILAWEFLTGCSPPLTSCGSPMPGNIVPMSRLDPNAAWAIQGLPLPNVEVSGKSYGILKLPGSVKSGSTFVIDDNNNSLLSTFAGFMNIPFSIDAKRTTSFRLYVNGTVVASTDVTYPIAPR